MPDERFIKHSAMANQARVVVSFIHRYLSYPMKGRSRHLKVALNAFVAQNLDGIVYDNEAFIGDLTAANNHEWHVLNNEYEHKALVQAIVTDQNAIDLFDINKPCTDAQLNAQIDSFFDAVRNTMMVDLPDYFTDIEMNLTTGLKIQRLRYELNQLYSEQRLYCHDYSKKGTQQYYKQAALLQTGQSLTAFASVVAPVFLVIGMLWFVPDLSLFALPAALVMFVVAYAVGASITAHYTPLVQNAAVKSERYHKDSQLCISAVYDNAANMLPEASATAPLDAARSGTSSLVRHSPVLSVGLHDDDEDSDYDHESDAAYHSLDFS